LFISCFGAKLEFPHDEQPVDFVCAPHQQAYYIMTDKKRLLKLGTQGITQVWSTDEAPQTMKQSQKRVAVLTTYNIYTFEADGRVLRIGLPHDRVWRDFTFDDTGDELWAMDAYGTIDYYRYDTQEQRWKVLWNDYPPLWSGDALNAVRILHIQKLLPFRTFLVMDKFAGVYWRSKPALPSDSKVGDWLKEYFNTGREVVVDCERWEDEAVLLVENNGRVVFILLPDLPEENPTIESLSQVEDRAFPRQVFAKLDYNPKQSTWLRNQKIVALQTIPETGTMIQLHENGYLEAIAMPQRHRINFKRTKYIRIAIPSLEE
jgi:hypothetical protein